MYLASNKNVFILFAAGNPEIENNSTSNGNIFFLSRILYRIAITANEFNSTKTYIEKHCDLKSIFIRP